MDYRISRRILPAMALVCLGVSYGQTLTNSDVDMYSAFFRMLVQLKHSPNYTVTVRDFIGLTDSEAPALTNTAADYLAKADAMLFQSRLRNIESGRAVDQPSDDLKDGDKQRVQLMHDHLNQLKMALGESHFAVLDAYIRAHKIEKDFHAMLLQAVGITVRK